MTSFALPFCASFRYNVYEKELGPSKLENLGSVKEKGIQIWLGLFTFSESEDVKRFQSLFLTFFGESWLKC